MRILKSRIVVSVIVILLVAYVWEFYVKPVSGPLYTEAVAEYKAQNYERSLELLQKAYDRDPNDTAILRLFGWNYLKSGKPAEAMPYFTRALRLNPQLEEARLGVAHCWVETGEGAKALEYFNQLPPQERNTAEIRVAMARAYRLQGDNQMALGVLIAVLSQDQQNKLAKKELVLLTGNEDLASVSPVLAPPPPRPASLSVAARLEKGYFHIPQGEGWKQIYIAGVNLSPAVPGHFPSDPPLELSVYLDWLRQIGAMGSNCVRAYTLLPPAFYRALATYNSQNARSPVYLFQQIWIKDPPDDNLFNAAFTADYERDIRNAVDAIHGQANLPNLKGQTGGIYPVDVSPFVLGWLIGREIPPHVVMTTNLRNPNTRPFEGQYLKISDGNPTEVWLTQRSETVVDYEVKKYNWQRPVAFVNWPPLDPLTHPTETRMVEEFSIRRASGESLAPLGLGVPDDNDAVSLDEEKVSTQPAFQAGYFAFYPIYPFWPDFISLDPLYRSAHDALGLNSYWGYLQDLKKHFQRTPLLVGEYGVSTSIGIAHFSPTGWNHGGLDEVQQGEALVRFTRNIRDAGYAGGIVFEWIDEWWKQSWITRDFEKPGSRKVLWHNDLDPNESFGLVQFLSGTPPPATTLFTTSNLPGPTPRAQSQTAIMVTGASASWDPGALFLELRLSPLPGGSIDWSGFNLLVGMNTCGVPCGSKRLPLVYGVASDNGFNFVLHIAGPTDSKLLVAHNYNPYRSVPVGGLPDQTYLVIPANLRPGLSETAPFDELTVEVNRRRYSRDGTLFPARRYNLAMLRYGNFEESSRERNLLAQWYYDQAHNSIRVRLSWGLLLVLDPSQGAVFWGTDESGETRSRRADTIQFVLVTYRPQPGEPKAVPSEIVPYVGVSASLATGLKLPWPTWEKVRTIAVTKASYRMLAAEFQKLTSPRE